MNFDLSEPPIIIGLVALIGLHVSERVLHLVGLHQPSSPAKEKLSLYACVLPWHIAVTFSFLDAASFHWTTFAGAVAVARYAGIPIIAAGLAVRMTARLTLRKQFSGHVQTTSEHTLVTAGIYGSLQHPAYLANLLMLLGFPLCFGSVAGLACAVVFGVPGLLYRMRVEEAALRQWFGEDYKRYQKETPRLIPFVW